MLLNEKKINTNNLNNFKEIENILNEKLDSFRDKMKGNKLWNISSPKLTHTHKLQPHQNEYPRNFSKLIVSV